MKGADRPFGVDEVLAATRDAARVLDLGCGSGRLTVALAAQGADVTGCDVDATALGSARDRAASAGVPLALVEADLNEPLPFGDAVFDAVTSRLALMIAGDPVATLREVGRVLVPGGGVATLLWSTLDRNPWFAEPRAAVQTVLGGESGRFARAFGRLGDPALAAAVHRDAGLLDVDARLLVERVTRVDARAHWRSLATENGHYRRLDATLDEAERSAVVDELARRLAPFRTGDGLALPRTLVLVTARRTG
jgi:SAM-dependent methyltransferase